MQRFVERYYNPLLLMIVAVAFFTRLYRVNIPERYMFDEVYHAVTAKLIAHNDPRAYEWDAKSDEKDTAIDWLHPPGAKLLQAGSMVLFGETSFAWRLSSVMFGTLVVLTTAWFAAALFGSKRLALLAALFAMSDGLLLVQSRIAMNDIHVTFFILQTFFWYWRYRQTNLRKYALFAAVMSGLAASSKWSGLFALAAVGVFEVTRLFAAKKRTPQLVQLLQNAALFAVTTVVIYLASYSQMWLQGKSWSHFVALHKQIWAYQTHLTATHPYQSTALQWFFNARPVWVAVEYGEKTRADIYAFGNPALFFWGALSVVATLLLVINFLKIYIQKKKLPKQAFSIVYILLCYLLVWTPWLFSPRVMFFYHYSPAVPLLSSILAYWLIRFSDKHLKSDGLQKLKSLGIYITLASVFIAAFIWFPHWTLLPVSSEFAEKVYFFFVSWK